MNSMLAAALEYHDFGWSVIPMKVGKKKPFVLWKHLQDQHPTRNEVCEWWTRWPDAGISLILGPTSGVVAVDVDSFEAHQLLCDLLDGEPKTLKSISGSRMPGKAHYLFQCPDFETKARYTPLHPKLEFRGYRGYVVLPPSLHPSRNRYEWSEPMREIAVLPDSLANAWRSNPRLNRPLVKHEAGRQKHDFGVSPRTLMNVLRLPGLAQSTQRWLIGDFAYDDGWNSRLFSAACDLVGLGVDQNVAEPLLLRGAMPRTAADEESARRTIRSAYGQERVPFRDFVVVEKSDCPSPTSPSAEVVRIIRPQRLRWTLRMEVR